MLVRNRNPVWSFGPFQQGNNAVEKLICWEMANRNDNLDSSADDRRDPVREGSSLSGSTKRNNDATEKAIHPERERHEEALGENSAERVDQDPGERQKENQNRSKDDPLAA